MTNTSSRPHPGHRDLLRRDRLRRHRKRPRAAGLHCCLPNGNARTVWRRVPEVASRQHVLSIIPVVEQTLVQSNITLKDVDAIAVTRGPGLAGSLVVGMNMAKGLALGPVCPSSA
jgi:tRNA A37 threonylcarbamoyladenosine modification protein TsaB